MLKKERVVETNGRLAFNSARARRLFENGDGTGEQGFAVTGEINDREHGQRRRGDRAHGGQAAALGAAARHPAIRRRRGDARARNAGYAAVMWLSVA